MHPIPRHEPHLVVRSADGLTVAALRGELDLVLVRHLRPELDALARGSGDLTLDVRRLTFCDATGLGLLARCAERTRERGRRWRLLCDQPWILRLIRLTALGDLLLPETLLPGVPVPRRERTPGTGPGPRTGTGPGTVGPAA
ncbi:STAS domain-containing protein [Streptomyces sp. NPDC012450]|uniref:STAS domain-containing protein n=1 Tax=Streptomyces sp. NPDC012450 TaxID=3364834 RepID=UPI0036EA32BF